MSMTAHILCKYDGQLVIADLIYNESSDAEDFKCPLCGEDEFDPYQGWLECRNCHNFSVLESQYFQFVEEIKNASS